MQRIQPFGPYNLVERIGVGAMGEVFRAVSRADGRLVAVKRLMPFVGADVEVVDTLHGEANLARTLDHPGVAKVIEVGDVRGVHYIAYEYVHGRDLRAIRERAGKAGETIPLDVGVHVIAAVALALDHAHTRYDSSGRLLGLVHRDVSPSNILVAFDGRVLLSDFGIARAEGRVAKTEAGQVKGTIGYMSPEQVTGSAIDGRSDIYGLGVCLWEVATGSRLYDSAPALVVMERIASGAVPAPRVQNPAVSPALEAVILKSLAQSPDQRYARAEDFHAELTTVARREGYLADSARVAHYVRGLFPEAAAEGAASRQEFFNMADSKGGSDLDVFEGLAKKSPRSVAPGLTPPPPSGGPRQRTLVGGLMGGPGPLPPPPTATMPSAAPSALPPPSLKPGAAGSPSAATPSGPPSLPKPLAAPATTPSAPPPLAAPSRGSGSLPPVSAPPARLSQPTPSSGSIPTPLPTPGLGALPPPTITPMRPPAALPPPSMPKPQGSTSTPLPPPQQSIGATLGMPEGKKASGKSVDMDWDDEEESTHVYDKQTHDVAPKGMRPAAGTPAMPKVGGAAAALLASSGGTAASAKSLPPVSAPPQPTPTIPSPSAPLPPMSAPPPYVAPPAPSRNEEPTAVRARPAPPQTGGSKVGVILGALALLAVLGLGAFMLFPRSGQFKIDIKSKSGSPVAKAEIFIDGQKKCDTAPCVVTDLSPGPKTIKVIAPDVPPSDPVTETVEAGKEKLVFITIDAAGTAVATGGGTGFKAQGPSGVRVLVDGADKGTLPVELKDLAAGAHKVRFEGERYEPSEQSIDVVANQMKDLGPIKLKVLKGMLSIELATAGASVTLMGQGGKKEKKTLDSVLKLGTPVKLSDIDASQSWKLSATKKGFQDFNEEISFDDGQAEKSIRIELTETGKPAPVAGVPGPGPAPVPGPAPGPGPTEPKPSPDATAAPAAGSGTLNINSIPVSKVVLDGRPLGSTPKVGVSVPAGSHTVTFIHPDLGKKSVTVSVKAGETKTAAVKFK